MAVNFKCPKCGATVSADVIPAVCPNCGAPTTAGQQTGHNDQVAGNPETAGSPAHMARTAAAAIPAADPAATGSQASPAANNPAPATPAPALIPVASFPAAPAAPAKPGVDWTKVSGFLLEILTIVGSVLPSVLTGGAAADAQIGAALLRIVGKAIAAHSAVATEAVDYNTLGQESKL